MIKLFNDDCLSAMQDIESGTIDMVLADPPYGTTKCKWDSVIDIELMWKELKRIIKPNGAIVLMAQTPFDKVLGASNLSMLKYEWIWEKGNATGFLNAKKMPLKAHENALVFSNDPEEHWNMMVFYNKLPTYNPQMTHGHERKKNKRKPVNSDCYGKAFNLTEYDSTSRYPRSVQFFSSDKQKGNYHATQKPVALGEFLIKTYTNEGGTVLDFTMGSGSFGVSAINTNRNFIGIEKDGEIFEIAEERIIKANVKNKTIQIYI
ncbi:DNA methylase [Vibrio phage douglas 12A4]|uniref:DNA methylase n=1 Tax=Vibrio phage douglas 12A4 TaxID=573171 RepID=UPI0002C134A9|nr:DNA methylase [Vibrio phage douglas 12A4]AGG58085.1 DNA methylase [Vibrio phage douglas 12A4]